MQYRQPRFPEPLSLATGAASVGAAMPSPDIEETNTGLPILRAVQGRLSRTRFTAVRERRRITLGCDPWSSVCGVRLRWLRGPAIKRYLAALSHAAGVDNTREPGLSLELVN